MAATNYTPIQLYYSTTASAAPVAGNLANGELAINITDGKLYYKDNSGTVQVIATKGAGTIGGSNTQIQYNNSGALAGSSAMTFNSGTNTVTLTTLNLTNALGATYGGTAQSSYTQGDLLYSSATNTLSKLGIGTVDYILTSTGSVPQWSAPSSISVLTATNLAGGSGGSVPYQSAASTTTFLSIGSSNTVMTSSGTAPQWSSSLTGLLSVSSSGITNVSLTSGRVVYSTTGGAQTDSSNLTFNGTTLSAGGFSTTGLSTLVKTVTIGNGNFSGVAVFEPNTPAKLYLGNGIVTDTTSAIGATNATGAIASLAVTPIAATNTSVTYTNAATLYIAGAPSAGTNVTLTNPYALYVAAGNTFLGGNLLFTDNTYNIGANGATRPANAWFSRVVTAGQGANNDWQFLAVDYGNGTGAGIYDGIYTSSIKAGTYQAFGFDTRYSNAGSWVGSQTTATIVDGYQGNFRVFTNSGLTAGTPYTPEQKLSISATGFTELRGSTSSSNNVFENLRIALIGGNVNYGGSIGQRIVVGDTRQGLYVKGTGSLTLLSNYNIDFLAGQTSVPVAADTGLMLRINTDGAAIGGINPTYRLDVFGASASAGELVAMRLQNGAGSTASVGMIFQTGANIATSGIYNATYTTNKAYLQLRTSDGSTLITRYQIDGDGNQTWLNVGGSSLGTKMSLTSTGLGIGGTPVEQFSITNQSGNSYAGMRLVGSNRGGYIDMYNQTYPVSRITTDQSGNFAIQNSTGFTAATMYDRLLIDPNGYHYWYNVGVTTGAVKMTLNATGLGIAGAPQSNYGVLQVYQESSGTVSSLGFIGTDNATISSKYSLVFQIDSASAQSGRAYTWKHNGKGYTDGDQLMVLNADTNQLLVGTSTAVTDNYAGTTYPAVVSVNGLAATGLGNSGSTSRISKHFSTVPGNTYTVRVYPSNTVYAITDIRGGGYNSSGSGNANCFFSYGGHVGGYQLNTVFNTYTGNITVSAPTVAGSYIQFTVTITGGSSGQYVVMVDDAGVSTDKMAYITVS